MIMSFKLLLLAALLASCPCTLAAEICAPSPVVERMARSPFGISTSKTARNLRLHSIISATQKATARTAARPVSASSPLIPVAVALRGGGGSSFSGAAADVAVGCLVLVAVTAAANSGSGLVAALFATAPTGVPLSLWLVTRSAGSPGTIDTLDLDDFLVACVKGTVALLSFCIGTLIFVRRSGPPEPPPSLGMLLAVGYLSWAVAWALLHSI